MATNRFDTVMSSNTLGQVPLMSLPFDQLDALLAQNQAKKDLFDERSEIDFDFIQQNEFDVNARKQIEDYRNKVKTQLSDIAAKGDTQGYLAGLSQATKNISSLFKAGGLANTLQERFNSVQAGMKSLKDKRTKDDGYGRLNYLHDLEKFKNQYTTAALNYDPVNRTAGQIGEAQITPFTDIKKGLLEQVKAIDPDMTEQDINTGAWIKRVKDKGVDPQRVQDIFDSYMSSPEILQQLDVEKWSLGKQVNKEDFVSRINNNRTNYNKHISETSNQIENLLASGKKDDIKAAQSFLNEQGFNVGKADGITGKKTKAAFEKYKNELTKRKKEILKNPDDKQFKSLLHDTLVKDYDKYFKGFFGQEHSEQLRENKFSLINHRIRAKAKAEEDALKLETYKTNVVMHGEYKNVYSDIRNKLQQKKNNSHTGINERATDRGMEFGLKNKKERESYSPEREYNRLVKDLREGGEFSKVGNNKEIWEVYGESIEKSTKTPEQLISQLESLDRQIHATRANNDYFIQAPTTEKGLKLRAENAVKYKLPAATSFTILNADGSKRSEVMKKGDLLKELNIESIEDLKKNAAYVGNTHPAGGTPIKGIVYNYGDVQFVAGTESLEQANTFEPLRAANEVLYNPNIKEGRRFMFDGIPTYTKIEYITQSTQYEDAINKLEDKKDNISDKATRDEIDKQIEEYQKEIKTLPFGGKGDIIGHYPAYYRVDNNSPHRPYDRGELHITHTEKFVQ